MNIYKISSLDEIIYPCYPPFMVVSPIEFKCGLDCYNLFGKKNPQELLHAVVIINVSAAIIGNNRNIEIRISNQGSLVPSLRMDNRKIG